MSAHERGWNAAKSNCSIHQNPYNRNDPRWIDWREGYCDYLGDMYE